MPTQTHIEPLAVPIPMAVRISGLSRSAIYRELAAGNLRAVKHRGRTLLMVDSIKRFLGDLPEARFRQMGCPSAKRTNHDSSGRN